MINVILSWLHAKLEYLVGTICGISVITFDIPEMLLKIAMAVILGAAGGLGSHLIKVLLSKFNKYVKEKRLKKEVLK
jgi:hypothetical protein